MSTAAATRPKSGMRSLTEFVYRREHRRLAAPPHHDHRNAVSRIASRAFAEEHFGVRSAIHAQREPRTVALPSHPKRRIRVRRRYVFDVLVAVRLPEGAGLRRELQRRGDLPHSVERPIVDVLRLGTAFEAILRARSFE